MLELTDISIRFGEKQVLSGVDLILEPGQRLAVMGPSGCGKTTLLKILLGLLRPDAGQVRNGFNRTAAVFQEPRLLPWRTAAENVNLVLGDKKATLPRAREALRRMELADAGDKYPRELSGGMQQRVAIARAMATQPELLVLDEPFKGMDAALRLRILRTLGQTDAAILLVTHDPREAEKLGCTVWDL